ncbi:MAG: DNA repair protein RadC [Deltaproteobacteria bacterium]|nr:DNA repair protein RadC [Deltaproteobacteria bacterium]
MCADPKNDNQGHRERLRERFRTVGLEAFHEHEVLELLLSFAIPRRDVKPLAKDLLRRFGSLREVLDADPEDLQQVRGIGSHASTLLKLAKSVAALYLKQRARQKTPVTCTRELIDFCRTALGGKRDEEFCVLYLDAQNQLIEFETIQRGIVNQAVVYPRQVLEGALKKKASAIILAHNHPSGHVRPSDADIRLTRTIQEIAKFVDILVHDHLIVGEGSVFSFREEGLIP